MEVSHEILRAGCIKFGPLFAEDLRHRESRWGSRRHLAETCTSVDGARHWFWRVMDRHVPVLDLFLQRHRNNEAAKTFLVRLLGEDNVPEVIPADRLRSCGAGLQEIPSLIKVDPQQVIRAARCHLIVAVLLKTTAGIQVKETRSGSPQPPRQNRQPKTRGPDIVNGCGRGRLRSGTV